jgi:alcohol dehydrogenase
MVYVPSYYEFVCPVKILSGNLALTNLPFELELLGAHRPMLVTDQGVVGAGLVRRVVAVFEGSGAEVGATFDETPVDSSDLVVAEVTRRYREAGCDALVAVGGGSCMDTAKGAAIMLSEGTLDLLAYQGADRLGKRTVPFIAIPTTAGTGSEVTSAAIIYNASKGIKMAITGSALMPDVAIIDAKMTLSAPARLTAATGMDALTHAIEASYCLQKNPVSDALALAAIRLIVGHLVRAVEQGQDETARLAMANAALLAGMAFSNSMVGMVHSLAHAAGGVAHVPHGVANSIFLPWGVEYNIPKSAAFIAELAPALGAGSSSVEPADQARAVVGAIRNLTAKLNALCGLPLRLRDAGVREADLEPIARAAVNDGSLAMNPEEMTLDDALGVLRKAY